MNESSLKSAYVYVVSGLSDYNILSMAEGPVIHFYARQLRRVLEGQEIDELTESDWGKLGPDPLRRDFSSRTFRNNIKEQYAREIGEVLLDQKVVSGIGNILRIEILFYSHIHPHRNVAELSDDDIAELLHWTMKLMSQWLKEMGTKKRSWRLIYRASGKPCPVCYGKIQFFRQAGRITYACPVCQK